MEEIKTSIMIWIWFKTERMEEGNQNGDNFPLTSS